ncbi:MAG: PqqD family protein [Candidatus Woesearchaeota archaeon]
MDNKIIKRNENIIFRKIEGMYVLLPMSSSGEDTEYIFNLNEIGSIIWEKIDGVKTFDEIVSELLKEFNGQPDVIRQQAKEFINEIKEAKLIEVL